MSRFLFNDIYYFITVPTINHQKFFNTDLKKKLILDRIKRASNDLEIENIEFGINSNHYHFLGYFDLGNKIQKFLNLVNGGSSFELNNIDKMRGREIWGEYHVYYVNNESVLYKITGYIIGNPYKHGEIKTMQNLVNYPFSSFSEKTKKIGQRETENMALSVIGFNNEDVKKEIMSCLKAV